MIFLFNFIRKGNAKKKQLQMQPPLKSLDESFKPQDVCK